MIYILLLLFCIFATRFVVDEKQQRIAAIILLVAMMLIVGLRDVTIGVDSERYAGRFMSNLDVESFYEPIFGLIINYVNKLGGSVNDWFMLLSVLNYSVIAYCIFKFSKQPLLAVLVFMVSFVHYFPETMNNLRQGLAISFLLLSFLTFSKNQYYIAASSFLIAAFTHISSLFALPFFLICRYNFSRRKILIILSASFLFGFISSYFISIEKLIAFIPSAFVGEGLDRISNYTEKSEHILKWTGLIGNLLPLNLLCFLLAPDDEEIYYLDPDEESENRQYQYLFNFYFWGIVIANIILGSVPHGMRYAYIFLIGECILFSNRYYKEWRLKPYLIFMIVFYCIYLYNLSQRTDLNMIIPYKFYFEQ